MTRPMCDIAIVGAGPYGLAAAARLQSADGLDVRVFGEPMSFWARQMPVGMRLRSRWEASHIAYPNGELSLDRFRAETGEDFGAPIPLERFLAYGRWFVRRAVANLDNRPVESVARENGVFRVELGDGERLTARRVVVAAGIAPFASKPPDPGRLPPELVSHTVEHPRLDSFSGRDVAVIGAGQSALESAALLHEAGARAEVIARTHRIVWLKGGAIQRRLGRAKPLFYAPTDVGPIGMSRLLAVPDLFRRFPRGAQDAMARRAIRPAGAQWLVDRLADVPLTTGRVVVAAMAADGRVRLRLDDGSARNVDHVLLATGYRVDLRRYSFLSDALLREIHRVDGYPVLRRGLESSVTGLHFLGAPAAWSFGPVMRFVSGTWYASRALVDAVVARKRGRASRP